MKNSENFEKLKMLRDNPAIMVKSELTVNGENCTFEHEGKEYNIFIPRYIPSFKDLELDEGYTAPI